MGYDFTAKNEEAGDFHLGAFSWPVLLEQFGTMFPLLHSGARYYMVQGVDERFNSTYPGILDNDGFEVTDEEARMMARMTRNYVAIQRSLPEENQSQSFVNKGVVTRDELMETLMHTMSGGPPPSEAWPVKIREDFTDKFEQFADWAEKSGGFEVG
jgi:hypothetical protein